MSHLPSTADLGTAFLRHHERIPNPRKKTQHATPKPREDKPFDVCAYCDKQFVAVTADALPPVVRRHYNNTHNTEPPG